MSRGRPQNKDKNDLERIFEKYEKEIVKDGEIIYPKSEIWSAIRTNNLIEKKEKAIYVAARRWLKQMQKAADNEQKESSQNENEISMETSMECTDISSHEDHNSPKDKGLKFQIQFTSKQWNTIKPIEVSYRRQRKGSQ